MAVPNALAALHNLALLPEAAEALATEKVAEVLLAHLAVAQAAAGGAAAPLSRGGRWRCSRRRRRATLPWSR